MLGSDIDDYLDRWRLKRDGAPRETPSSLVAFVRRDDGSPAVLKIANARSDERQSPAVLRLWDGEGAVRLYEWDGSASLMERAVPGTELASIVAEGRDDEATGILADLMAKLRSATPPPGTWTTLADWANAVERQKGRPVDPHLPHALLDRAAEEFRDLIATTHEAAFIHGDLHHYNVLRDDRRGWLAIDPKGIVGDPAFEVASSLRNPIGLYPYANDPKVMARRVDIYAEHLGFDRRRILRWAWCLMILSACWNVEDGDGPISVERSLELANVVESLLL